MITKKKSKQKSIELTPPMVKAIEKLRKEQGDPSFAYMCRLLINKGLSVWVSAKK